MNVAITWHSRDFKVVDDTQYCSIATFLLTFPFTRPTSHLKRWQSGGKGWNNSSNSQLYSQDKTLSYRREAMQCFVTLNIVTLNISLSRSRSLKVVRNDTLEYGKSVLLVFHCNYVSIYCIASRGNKCAIVIQYDASHSSAVHKLHW